MAAGYTIKIDLSELAHAVNQTPYELMSDTIASVQRAQQVVRSIWTHKAQAKLRTFRAQYIQAIKIMPINIQSGYINGDVILQGRAANNIEQGAGPWDLRAKLLSGKRASANLARYGTRFVRVPFRFTQKKSTAAGAQALPPALMKQIKAGVPKTMRMKGDVRRNPVTGVPWKVPQYKNLTDYEHVYPRRKETKRFTFRTVSENTPIGKWMHPGWKAQDLAKETEKDAQPLIEKLFE